MAPGWYVVNTHARAEDRAACNLRRQGFEIYLPRYAAERRHARRVERIERPLFPRYLFVRFDPAAQIWRPVLSTIGVSGLICADAAPLRVPDAVVDGIRLREGGDGLVVMAGPDGLQPGDRVMVTAGSLAGLEGVFLHGLSDEQRVCVMLSLLGRPVRVALATSLVEAHPQG